MILPNYKIISKIGADETGEYFRATMYGQASEGFSKTVIIKKYHRKLLNQKHIMSSLAADVKMFSVMTHSNIVQILNFHNDETQAATTLEFVDGKSLRNVFDHSKQIFHLLPWQASLYIAMEALKGLEYAHTVEGAYGPLKILHREIVPENIFLTYDGQVKVTNFENYRLKQLQARSDMDRLKKNFSYSSPEILNNENALPASDVFSIGAILYELLTLRHVTGEIENYQALKMLESHEYESVDVVTPSINSRISQIIDQALAANASERFWSASTFYDALLETQDPNWVTRGQALLRTYLGGLIPVEQRKEEQLGKSIEYAKKASSPTQPILVEEEPDSSKKLMILAGGITVAVLVILVIAFIRDSQTNTSPNVFIKAPVTQRKVVPNANPDSNRQNVESTFETGKLEISGPDGTAVYINGDQMGMLPMAQISLPPKSYTLELKNTTLGERTKIINIKTQQVLKISW